MQVHVYHINIVSVVGKFSYNIWILLNTILKYLHWSICKTIQMLSHGTAATTPWHHLDPMYMHTFTRLFIDRMDINFMDIYFHRISSELWPSGYNGGLVNWRSCSVGGSNPTVDKVFFLFTCSVFLTAGLAAFKLNREWHSSEEVDA